MIEQDSIETAKKWILQALHDKETAQAILQVEAYDTAAFLAHQSVEKLLKGIIILKGGQVPKHHHLDLLAQQLGVLDEIRDDLGEILSDYQISRYPDVSGDIPYLQYSLKISEEKITHADKIFERLKMEYMQII